MTFRELDMDTDLPKELTNKQNYEAIYYLLKENLGLEKD